MTEVDVELAELRDHMSLPPDADAVTIVRHAKIAFDLSEAASTQPKVEQLIAEVERLKDVDAEAFGARFQLQSYDIVLGRIARVLTRLLADANISPLPKRLPHLAYRVEEEFQAVVRQRGEALAALEKQQALLSEAREVLERAGCQFDMCTGPTTAPVDMRTCFVCEFLGRTWADQVSPSEDSVEGRRD